MDDDELDEIIDDATEAFCVNVGYIRRFNCSAELAQLICELIVIRDRKDKINEYC
jgi:hypothetical protein